jgi:hypothetical protein
MLTDCEAFAFLAIYSCVASAMRRVLRSGAVALAVADRR